MSEDKNKDEGKDKKSKVKNLPLDALELAALAVEGVLS